MDTAPLDAVDRALPGLLPRPGLAGPGEGRRRERGRRWRGPARRRDRRHARRRPARRRSGHDELRGRGRRGHVHPEPVRGSRPRRDAVRLAGIPWPRPDRSRSDEATRRPPPRSADPPRKTLV